MTDYPTPNFVNDLLPRPLPRYVAPQQPPPAAMPSAGPSDVDFANAVTGNLPQKPPADRMVVNLPPGYPDPNRPNYVYQANDGRVLPRNEYDTEPGPSAPMAPILPGPNAGAPPWAPPMIDDGGAAMGMRKYLPSLPPRSPAELEAQRQQYLAALNAYMRQAQAARAQGAIPQSPNGAQPQMVPYRNPQPVFTPTPRPINVNPYYGNPVP